MLVISSKLLTTSLLENTDRLMEVVILYLFNDCPFLQSLVFTMQDRSKETDMTFSFITIKRHHSQPDFGNLEVYSMWVLNLYINVPDSK